MKRLFLALMLAMPMLAMAASTVNINGTEYPVDTLENYQVGPGTYYTRFNVTMGSTLHKMYLLTVDLTNPYIQIEECQGGGIMGKTEHMTDSHQRLDSAQHHPIGSVNCNFWVVSGNLTNNPEAVRIWSGLLGQPFSGTAHDGVLIGDPSENWNRGRATSDPNREVGFFIIDDQKRAFVEDMRYKGYVRINNDTCFLRDCNRTRENPDEHELVLFNHYIGKPTRTIQNQSGLEVVLRLTEPWAINKELECEVTAINQTGGTTINPGYAVLQARGLQAIWLSQVKEGDKLVLNTVVETRTDGIRKAIREMVTGNGLVLFHGEQTIRNTNESYNNQNYPRTMIATNDDGTMVWLLVSEKPGNYTSEMCSLLQNVGATNAVCMDGGGSAQMNLFGKIQNTTTEGAPRAVANSLFVVNTAPDDDEVTALSTKTTEITLPRYARIHVEVAAYNKYGTLLAKDYPVEYSCEPEVGYITADNDFVCLGNGTLKAKAGKTELEIPVTLKESTNPHFSLDSVLVSSNTDYELEIYATSGNDIVRLVNEGFSFTIDDPEVCKIENGVLNGLKDGRTVVSTTVDGTDIQLLVNVEIPTSEQQQISDFNSDADLWELKASSSSWKPTLVKDPQTGTALQFTYSATRNGNIKLTQQLRLWSLPNAIELRLNPQNLSLEKVAFRLKATTDKSETVVNKSTTLTANETNSVTLSLDTLFPIPSKIDAYPLTLTGITLYPQDAVAGTTYSVLLEGIWLHYDNISLSVPLLEKDSHLIIYPNPTSSHLSVQGISEPTTAIIYDLQGHTISHTQLTKEETTLSVAHLTPGTYILQINNLTWQFIVK